MAVYKIGDLLIHRRSKKVCEITHKFDIFAEPYTCCVYQLDNYGTAFQKDLESLFDRLDDKCPVVRMLYKSNSNKAVKNEKDEEQ